MSERHLVTWREYAQRARALIPHVTALLFVALLGWLSGFLQATQTGRALELQDDWVEPNYKAFHASEGQEAFGDLDIWDGKKPAAVVKKAATAQQLWYFIGTTRIGDTYAALILQGDGSHVQSATPGDFLPGGEKIISVENGTLQIEDGENQRAIKLFQQEKK
jgi:hypothetical protein